MILPPSTIALSPGIARDFVPPTASEQQKEESLRQLCGRRVAMSGLSANNRTELGTTGIMVSPLGFGSSPLGNEFGAIDVRTAHFSVMSVESDVLLADINYRYSSDSSVCVYVSLCVPRCIGRRGSACGARGGQARDKLF
jgi:hypothetical protein